jgi:hypothetical protein
LKTLVISTAPFLPVFQIREILARIWIIGSIPEKTDMDTYKCLWNFDKSYLFGGIEMQENSEMYLTL